MSDYIIAADVGGSRLRLILTDKSAEIIDDVIIKFDRKNMTKEELDELEKELDEIGEKDMTIKWLNNKVIKETGKFLRTKGIDKSSVMGITLGSAGVPDGEILTNSPNVPAPMKGRIEFIPPLGDAFGWDKRYVNNDCSAAAECAKRYGHKRQEIKLGDPYASEPYAYRFANRPGDDTKEDYKVVVYWTISSGTNIGVKIDDLLFKGEFGTIPEFGHHVHAMKDPFGNDLRCGEGAFGHLEAVVSGNGIARIMRNAVSSGAIPPGPLYNRITSETDDKMLPVILFRNLTDEKAREIVNFVSLCIARTLGVIISCYGPGKIEIGGGVMKSFEHVLIPAIELLDTNPDYAFYLQRRDKTSLPDICVAKGYGDDYVWRGAVAGFLSKYK